MKERRIPRLNSALMTDDGLVRIYDPADFWVPIHSPKSKRVVLDPGDFYLMASKERFSVPPSYAAEMEPFQGRLVRTG